MGPSNTIESIYLIIADFQRTLSITTEIPARFGDHRLADVARTRLVQTQQRLWDLQPLPNYMQNAYDAWDQRTKLCLLLVWCFGLISTSFASQVSVAGNDLFKVKYARSDTDVLLLVAAFASRQSQYRPSICTSISRAYSRTRSQHVWQRQSGKGLERSNDEQRGLTTLFLQHKHSVCNPLSKSTIRLILLYQLLYAGSCWVSRISHST